MKRDYFFAAIFFPIIVSCPFPNKSTQEKILVIGKDLNQIKSLIVNEFKENSYSVQVLNFKNQELKKHLEDFGISEISIHYTSLNKNHISTAIPKENLAQSFDSTIILSWNKSTTDKMIAENLIYFFSTEKPRHVALNSINLKEKKINDSIWFQKTSADIITVY